MNKYHNTGEASLKSQAKPVSYRGAMVDGGYRPENWQWGDELADRGPDGRGRIGKDPMALSTEILTASGHPQAPVRSVIRRMRVMHGVDTGEAREDGLLGRQPSEFPKRLTEIREAFCLPCCSNNKAEVRRCGIYDCPSWPYRMGRNPHNPMRGKKPAWLNAKAAE